MSSIETPAAIRGEQGQLHAFPRQAGDVSGGLGAEQDAVAVERGASGIDPEAFGIGLGNAHL